MSEETPDLAKIIEDVKEQSTKLKKAQDENKKVQNQLDKLKLSLNSLNYKKKELMERKTLLQEKYRINKQKLEKTFLLSNKYNMNIKCLKGHKERLFGNYGKTSTKKIKENSGFNDKLLELRKRKVDLEQEIGENNTKLKAIFQKK